MPKFWGCNFSAVCRSSKDTMVNKTRTLSYRKDDRVMRPLYACPENF